MALTCNIEKSDRTNRIVIGIIIILGAILGFGRFWAILVGAILIVEGYIGWCAIPVLMEKFKGKSGGGDQPPSP